MIRSALFMLLIPGGFLLYIGAFALVDGRGNIQDQLIEFWVQTEAARASREAQLAIYVRRFVGFSLVALDHVFGPRTWSLRSASMVFALATASGSLMYPHFALNGLAPMLLPSLLIGLASLLIALVIPALQRRLGSAGIGLAIVLTFAASLLQALLVENSTSASAGFWIALPAWIFFIFVLSVVIALAVLAFIRFLLASANTKSGAWGLVPLSGTVVVFVVLLYMMGSAAPHAHRHSLMSIGVWPVWLALRMFGRRSGLSPLAAYHIYFLSWQAIAFSCFSNLATLLITGVTSIAALTLLSGKIIWSHFDRALENVHQTKILTNRKLLVGCGLVMVIIALRGTVDPPAIWKSAKEWLP